MQILVGRRNITLKDFVSRLAGLTIVGAISALSTGALSDPPTGDPVPLSNRLPRTPNTPSAIQGFGRLPLAFEPNQGQADRKARFLTHSLDSALSLSPSEAVFTLPTALETQHTRSNALARSKARPVLLHMQLVGADPHAADLKEQRLEGRANYFTGHDPGGWHTDIPTFGKVGFQGVYPGVDVVYYGNQRRLEYDFVVAPHADSKQIQLHFAGAQSVRIDKAGDLVVRAEGREMTWQKPVVYQRDATGRHSVAAHFRLKRLPDGHKGVSFALGRYDAARPLVIDPVLIYSTFLPLTNFGVSGMAVDSAGSAYIAANSSTIFQGYIQILKLNPTGTALVYSTTLGPQAANVNTAAAHIAVDSSGNAYITGNTDSNNFPTTPGAFKTQHSANPRDAFVTKLNPAGDGLVYSTFLGGGISYSLALDSSSNAYITGFTDATDFPVTPGAFQTVNHAPAHSNVFVTKLNAAGTALVYSTYLGGTVDLSNNAFYTDRGADIAVDASGAAYITGTTASSDFPTTPNAFQTTNRNLAKSNTGFVTKLNATGTALLYSTYFGGTTEEEPRAIAIDGNGSAYITGQTNSRDLPTTPGAFQSLSPPAQATTTGFVARFNAAGSGLIYGTYLGGKYDAGLSEVIPYSIAVDSGGDAYVTGGTKATDFPTTIGAFKRVQQPLNYPNAFVTRLNASGTALISSTLLGGTFQNAGNQQGDKGYAIALGPGGSVYVAGGTQTGDFPTTPDALLGSPVGTSAFGFATKLSTISIFPDFNNDGFTDLLIQNASTGQIVSGFLQGTQWFDGAYFSLTPPSDFAVVGVGSFSNTGVTTLVLQSRTTNQIALWYATGTNSATIDGGNLVNMAPPAGWKVVGVGDFNGDQRSDLVFQNQTTGLLALWYMNGYLYQDGNSLDVVPLAGWQVVGVGDFNKDGFPDIAFQDQTTGKIALWYMHGKTYVGGTVLPNTPAAGWKVVGVGDYNGDGSADLLFQNQTTNQAIVWYLQNGVYSGGGILSQTPPSGWKIVGPR